MSGLGKFRAAAVCIVLGGLLGFGAPAQAIDYDCDDFASSQDAQDYYVSQPGDPSDLDRDNDGYACDFGPSSGDPGSGHDGSGEPAADAGDSSGWLLALGLIGPLALWLLWASSSQEPKTANPSPRRWPEASTTSRTPTGAGTSRLVTSEPEPAYNLFVRLRNRSPSAGRLQVVDSYISQSGRPRDEILTSLVQVARANNDPEVVEFATALIEADEPRGGHRQFVPDAFGANTPLSPPTMPVGGHVAASAAAPSVNGRVPAHLNESWQPARRHNENAATSVRKLWEHHSRHELTSARRREFLSRSEVASLASLVEDQFEFEVVVRAASRAVSGNGEGHLLLDQWLRAAEEEIAEAVRRERLQISSQREAEKARAEVAQRASIRALRCESCGRGIGINGECGCS